MPAQMLKAIKVCVFIKAKKSKLSFQICEFSHLNKYLFQLLLKVFKELFKERFWLICSMFYCFFVYLSVLGKWPNEDMPQDLKVAISNFFLLKTWRGVYLSWQRLQTAYDVVKSTLSELQIIWVTVRSSRQCYLHRKCSENY